MKIGILTQPLHNNYGGILQNYALQTILKREGFNPRTINRCKKKPSSLYLMRIASILKRGLLKYVLRKKIRIRIWPTKKEEDFINQNINQFVCKNIIQTEKFHNNNFNLIKKYAFDAYIVGSDQVWRPLYSPCITNYFFDFLSGNTEVKKIAYAASFGVDEWEMPENQTKNCSVLARQFDAISVREFSAIELCRKYLGVDAVQVLDPTMLLKKEDYIDLVNKDNVPVRKDILYNYILDKSDEKIRFVNKIAEELNLHSVSGMPSASFHPRKPEDKLSDCIFPSVTEWLAGFRDAKFVVTDSFHGTVFSIIFNIPFVVFANESRGNARFDSLLKMFKLEKRLITNLNCENQLLQLDFTEANRIMEKEKEKSLRFLLETLR